MSWWIVSNGKKWSTERWCLTWIWLTVTFNIQRVHYTMFDYQSIGRVIASNGLHRVIIAMCVPLNHRLLACLPFTVTVRFLFGFRIYSSFGNLFKVTHSLPIKYVCFIIYSVSLCLDGSMKGAIPFLFIDSTLCFFCITRFHSSSPFRRQHHLFCLFK